MISLILCQLCQAMVGDAVADAMTMIWEELAAQDAAKTVDAKTQIKRLGKELRRRGVVSAALYRERWAPALILDTNISDAEIKTETGQSSVERSLARIKTAHRWSQSKFNLCREEMEGYAKLITAVHPDTAAIWPASTTVQHCLFSACNSLPERTMIINLAILSSVGHRPSPGTARRVVARNR
jgi:hypothetical protein